MKKVQIITDGACLGNPGPGGWTAILRYGPHRREIFGCEPAFVSEIGAVLGAHVGPGLLGIGSVSKSVLE